MSWFKELKTRLLQAGKSQPERPSSRSWLLEARPQPQLLWTTNEIGILLDAEKRSQLCYAISQEHNATLQSVILGFDLGGNQLLLDDFFPSPASGMGDNHLTLTLPTSLGALHLEVEIIERIRFGGDPALVARIHKKTLYPEGKGRSRIAFDKNQSPTIELLLAMTPLMHGHVLDLCQTGLLMSCAATQKPSIFTHHGTCKIVFTTHFCLSTKVRIRHLSFHRKPFRHSLLRVEFEHLDDEQKDQLAMFIRQFENTAEQSFHAA